MEKKDNTVEQPDNSSKAESESAVALEQLVRMRPKTRGELVACLKQGIECEVVSSNQEITNIFLDGWLDFAGKYKTFPSENVGWTVYKAAQHCCN